MLLSSDVANATVKSIGLATIGLADALEELKPDLILLLGDRYEMLAAVSAALIYKIPVAHLHGGEITEGAYDDSIRHAITKMSHLHFTSTEEYRKRVIQLGESPERVFNVGALGVENVLNTPLMTRAELVDNLKISLERKLLLVTFHPVTLDINSSEKQISSLLSVLEDYSDYDIIFTMPNSDTDGHIITEKIVECVGRNKNMYVFQSLGKLRYFSILQFTTAVIGNSSSGIIEVPCFGVPTLNIGNRQKGRTMGSSILNCDATYESIKEGIKLILSPDMKTIARRIENPYAKIGTVSVILKTIKEYPLEGLVNKTFYNYD
jgi:UDP-N-acetylglucosamine 2-epimerase (non-hydrolysing)/GDP/UDP-N,N'-diacetylbacillosamine 2-epimerase (hydrolysing)